MSMDRRFGIVRQIRLASVASFALTAALAAGFATNTAYAQADANAVVVATPAATAKEWPTLLWNAAKAGDESAFLASLNRLTTEHGGDAGTALGSLAANGEQLRSHFALRESDRAARAVELHADLDKHLAEPETPLMLAKCLRSAIELEMIAVVKGEAASDPRIAPIVAKAIEAAHAAESSGEILTASELFVLLNALHEEAGTYLPDVERLNNRLSMLRLYAPTRLYDMRVERSKVLGEEAKMAPYNSLGDNYIDKLKEIDQTMVLRAIAYSVRHVEKPQLSNLLIGGLANVRNLVTTTDLASTFPAQAARQMGWGLVPMMCAREIPVPGSLRKVIRVLVHWNTAMPQSEIIHVYLKDAVKLRPDLIAAQ